MTVARSEWKGHVTMPKGKLPALDHRIDRAVGRPEQLRCIVHCEEHRQRHRALRVLGLKIYVRSVRVATHRPGSQTWLDWSSSISLPSTGDSVDSWSRAGQRLCRGLNALNSVTHAGLWPA